jgi:hypothetical protein
MQYEINEEEITTIVNALTKAAQNRKKTYQFSEATKFETLRANLEAQYTVHKEKELAEKK